MLTLNEIIENLLRKYEIEITPKRMMAVRKYISREISKSSELQSKYESPPSKSIAKTKAKLFDKSFVKEIEHLTNRYLLKIKGVADSDYEKAKNNIPFLSSQLNDRSRINMFIEHLFYENYYFDQESYHKDLNSVKTFLKTEKEPTPEDIQLLTKVNNPRQYYISKKTK